MESSAGIILYRQRQTIELLLVNDSFSNKRHWTPPKGKLIGQEEELQCAVRIVPDVTGLSVKDIHVEDGFRAKFEYLSGTKPKRSVFFLARLANNVKMVPGGLSGLNIAWMSVKQAMDRAMFKSMQDVLEQAAVYIETRLPKQQPRDYTHSNHNSNVDRSGRRSDHNNEGMPNLQKLSLHDQNTTRRGGNGSGRDDEGGQQQHGSPGAHRGFRRGIEDEARRGDSSARAGGFRDSNGESGHQPEGSQQQQTSNIGKSRTFSGKANTARNWRGGAVNNEADSSEGGAYQAEGGNPRSSDRDHNQRDEPASARNGPQKDPTANPLYKTKLCERFKTDGHCPYNKNCTFAHGPTELRDRPQIQSQVQPQQAETHEGSAFSGARKDGPGSPLYKTRMCDRFSQDGYCQYGPRCNFAHSPTELRERVHSSREDDDSGRNEMTRERAGSDRERWGSDTREGWTGGEKRTMVGTLRGGSAIESGNGARYGKGDGFEGQEAPEPAREYSRPRQFSQPTTENNIRGPAPSSQQPQQPPREYPAVAPRRGPYENDPSSYQQSQQRSGGGFAQDSEAYHAPTPRGGYSSGAGGTGTKNVGITGANRDRMSPSPGPNSAPGPRPTTTKAVYPVTDGFAAPRRTPSNAKEYHNNNTNNGHAHSFGGGGNSMSLRPEILPHQPLHQIVQPPRLGPQAVMNRGANNKESAKPIPVTSNTIQVGMGRGGYVNGAGKVKNGGGKTPSSMKDMMMMKRGDQTDRPWMKVMENGDEVAGSPKSVHSAVGSGAATTASTTATATTATTAQDEKTKALEAKLIQSLSLIFHRSPPPATAPATPAATPTTDEIKEVTRLEFKHDLSKRQLLSVVVGALVLYDGSGKATYESRVVRSRVGLLKQLVRSGTDQLVFLKAWSAVFGSKGLEGRFGVLCKDLYDTDLVDEDVFIKWYHSATDWGKGESGVSAAARPFVEWLQTAEEEED